jgi:hypothetical protein
MPKKLKPAKKEPPKKESKPKDLEIIRRFVETTDIHQISDDMRFIVEKHLPWLVWRLPPKQ